MDELELIHDFVATAARPSDARRRAARASLQTQIDAELQSTRRKRVVPWKRLVSLTSMAGALAIGALLVLNPLLPRGQGSAAAAAVLRNAARTALLQPVHTLQPGEYAYTKSVGAYFDQVSGNNHTWGALVRTTRETWIAADGSGRIRQVSALPVFLAPSDKARWEAAGSPPLTELSSGETYDHQFGPGGLAYPLDIDGFHQGDLLRLASDPTALAAAIRTIAEQTSNPLGWEMLTVVGDILGESAAPPRLRASLYQVAATIPGIELVGAVVDNAGRQGIAVAASRDDLRYELVFDPKTSELLASEQTLRQSNSATDAPVGTATSYTLYRSSKITATAS